MRRMFMESKNKQRVTISPHLSLAVLQFLTTSVKVGHDMAEG